jgi:hypothetical protein
MDEHKIKFSRLVCENNVVRETDIRFIKQSDISRCPFMIFSPDHYRDDGSCKSNNPEYRKKVMRKWGYTKKDFIEAGLIPEGGKL